jgi:hypothetical protein
MKQRCGIQNKDSLKFGTRVFKFGTSGFKPVLGAFFDEINLV